MRKSTGIPVPDLVETAVQSLGLRDVAPFDPTEKVLGMPKVEGPLVQRATFDFVDEVSRDSPAPGGGSVAALAGALGGALAAMVANLCCSKGEFDAEYETLCAIADRGQSIKDALVRGVDDDTAAFDKVLEAMRMPRDTEAERHDRDRAMQEGYKVATRVPLTTVEQCRDALALCDEMAPLADPNMVSDVGTGALLAHAGAQAAAYNVRINLPQITDAAFDEEIRATLGALLEECGGLAGSVAAEVERTLAS
jgi:glutamate formiminotransferase/formiminotetrahydrofolate cyclodeaminase